MKIYKVKYADEEVNITYGIFSSRQKAETARAELLSDVDDEIIKPYWEREVYITESTIDKLTQRINT